MRSVIAEFRTSDLSRYTTVYLIDNEAFSSDTLVSGDTIMSASKNIRVITSWSEFISLNSRTPVDVVFIHSSIAESVDQAWLQAAYRNGLPIVTVNMTFGERAKLTGDFCGFAEYPSDGPLSNKPIKADRGDFYIFSYWLLHSGDAAAVAQEELNQCNPQSTQPSEISTGSGMGLVENAEGLYDLVKLGLLANEVQMKRAVELATAQIDQIMETACRPPLNATD